MKNKILIVERNHEKWELLEQALQEIVEEGGELIFTDNLEQGLVLLDEKRPQLALLDPVLVGRQRDKWERVGTHLMWIGEDIVLEPFEPIRVLEQCRSYLEKQSGAQTLPM